MRFILCFLAALLLCGCTDRDASAFPPDQHAAAAEPDALPALICDMLIKSDETISVAIPADAVCDPDAAVQAAICQHVLARTMLRTVTWSRTGDCLTVTAYYGKSTADLRKEKQILAESVSTWQRGYSAEPAAVQVLLAHDLLCRQCTYSETVPDCHSAYGAWFGNQAACDGYAEAFALMTETAGIPVQIITGTVQNGDNQPEPHAWNLVQLSGAWYHLDCTWDDTGEIPQHTYFLCDDAALSQTHKWDTKKYPPAHGGGYCYETIVSEMMEKVRQGGCGYSG